MPYGFNLLVRCPIHGREMIYGGVNAVRCPETQCTEFRRTECGAFLRRERPSGRTIVCRRPVAVETWAIMPDGREAYHGGRCNAHPDAARYGPGGRIEFRNVNGLSAGKGA